MATNNVNNQTAAPIPSGSPKQSRWGRRLLGKLRSHKNSKSLKNKSQHAEHHSLFTIPLEHGPFADDNCEVPVVLRIMWDFVEKHVADDTEAAIYVSEKHGKADMLRQQLEDVHDFCLNEEEGVDVVVVATLIKRWFQEQEGAFVLFDDEEAEPTRNTTINAVELIKTGLESLPKGSAVCLAHLAWHCEFVAKHGGAGVTLLTLAESFSRPTGIATEHLLLMIMQQDNVFDFLQPKAGARPPCTCEMFQLVTGNARHRIKPAPTTPRRKSKLAIKTSPSALVENDVESIQIEIRSLEMNLSKHRRNVKIAGERRKEYKSMDKMLTIQRELTTLKRSLKSKLAAKDEEEQNEMEIPDGNIGMLMKQLREHQFENKELVAIKKKLGLELALERGKVEQLRIQCTNTEARTGAPLLEFAEPASVSELMQILETQKQAYASLELIRKRNDEALVKERHECAAIHTQIHTLTGSKKDGSKKDDYDTLSRVWSYRLEISTTQQA